MIFFKKIFILSIDRYIRYKNCLKNWLKEKIISNNPSDNVKSTDSIDSTENVLDKYLLDKYIQRMNAAANTNYNGLPLTANGINTTYGNYPNITAYPSVYSSPVTYPIYTSSVIDSFNELVLHLKRIDDILHTDYFNSIDVQMIIEEMKKKIIEIETDKIKQKLSK